LGKESSREGKNVKGKKRSRGKKEDESGSGKKGKNCGKEHE